MGWYKDIKTILAQEPETWLAYLYGKHLENMPHLTRTPPRYRGLSFQLARFFLHILRHFGIRQPSATGEPTKFFVFAGSINQKNSLDTTIESLRDRGESVFAVAPNKFVKEKEGPRRYVPLTYSLLDACKAMILLVCRGPSLFRELKGAHPVAISWYFANFCSAYSYLCYFQRTLTQLNAEFVITANDHNVSNRCMLAVAHNLGIKTVYLQHASVSNLFPALRVNYAFLDGQSALNTYRQCEPNKPDTAWNVPIPEVILSGQKKHLKRSDNPNKTLVGVALNALDNVKIGIEFINGLADNGLHVRLRWHPSQTERDTAKFREAFSASKHVSLSDPRQEPISDFMDRIGWLIAGNSSIHLEAAVAGVMPIYYELTPAAQPDYYGYLKHGLCQPAASVMEVLELVRNTRDNHSPKTEAVRYYSSTYLTEWESREGVLVAECLHRLSVGQKLPVEAVDFGQKNPAVEYFKDTLTRSN